MSGFLLRRLAASFLLLLLVPSILFFGIHALPGDPTRLIENQRVSPEQRLHLRHVFGLDRPLPVQYMLWLKAALVGEWGFSFAAGRPVAKMVTEALSATLVLAMAATLIEYGGGLLLGVAAARRPGSATDHLIRVASLLLYSQPTFWLSLMALLLFSYSWRLLPATGMHSPGMAQGGAVERLLDLCRHLVLPALVLGGTQAGASARFVRGSLLEVMGRDYIRTARAKGLSERRVLWVHGLRNALVPLIQLFALSFPSLLSGSLITEVVFAWPGLGRLTYDAILSRDYPVVVATTGLSAVLVVFANFAADLFHALVDPRVRDG